jgi:hypothetical protein
MGESIMKEQLNYAALLSVLDQETVDQLRKAVNVALDQSLMSDRWYLTDVEVLKFIDRTYKGGLQEALRHI